MSEIDFFERQAMMRAEQAKNANKAVKSEKIKQKSVPLPVEYPKGYSYPDFKTVFKEEKVPLPPPENTVKEKHGGLNDLLKDPESALLTGLIMLLKSEGADEALLAALGYILL